MFHASYRTDEGELVELEGEGVEQIARQLPEGFRGKVEVCNEAGFTQGWALSRTEWQP